MATRKKSPRAKARGREPSFGEAIEEVEGILGRLESQEVDIDDLSREVRRAVELIKLCRGKLERTDRDVRELVAELEGDGETGRRAVAAAASPAGAEPGPDGPAPAADGERVGGDADADVDADDLPF